MTEAYIIKPAVHQAVINLKMHMHEITQALMAKQDCQPMSYVSQRTLLLFILRWLYSNLFLALMR